MMGIEYRGVVCVGYTYGQVQALYEKYENEKGGLTDCVDFYDFCERNALESFSPYYDADKEDCIYGIPVVTSNDYSYEVLSMELDSSIVSGALELYERFTLTPKAYLMAQGW